MQYELKKISKRFPMPGGFVEVFHNLNCTVQAGEWVALTGRSGCGKTTLLHLLGGLDRPTSGEILLDGEDLAKASNKRLTEIRRSRIGFIFQSYQLFPELTALENAVLPALRWGNDRSSARKRAQDYLALFGLEKRLHHRPKELSGGEQQRVAIARALMNTPDILLADEPTGNLDPAAAADIVRILDDLRKNEHKTILMVTHDQTLAKKADRIFKIA